VFGIPSASLKLRIVGISVVIPVVRIWIETASANKVIAESRQRQFEEVGMYM
jgi:hypothetical protein